MNKVKLKTVALTVIHILLLCFIVFYMWLFFALGPYDYRFDYSMKVIDYMRMDFYKLLWFFGVSINTIIAVIAKKYSKAFYIIHMILAQLCIAYFCWLLTL